MLKIGSFRDRTLTNVIENRARAVRYQNYFCHLHMAAVLGLFFPER